MSEDTLHLALDGYEGPLDLLLELARAQKVDLAHISILQVVEQYLALVDKARAEARAFRLELAADWLVMAAWLAWLKSRLLLPAEQNDPEAEEAAGLLQGRLVELEIMRKAALWLAGQPRLGTTVFRRGAGEDHTEIDRSGLRVDLPSLITAYVSARRRTFKKRVYTPKVRRYWSVQDALQRLRALLSDGHGREWCALTVIVPELFAEEETAIGRHAALAGSLVAGLEMAKTGLVQLRQDEAFSEIQFRSAAV
ncbi:segregation/condensation protein A [Neokomagataea tanensis]|uniref:Segregation and condensation protein A n=1 Tax=Neokomagataea tanensis TaxID=661191 RepID=A0A4Y6VBX7_9PROT|nr:MULTISPECIES: ScpA family protein [Neokomagataea]QDH25967.1 segregation/condensation protein A [Neokomagataea tanensis]